MPSPIRSRWLHIGVFLALSPAAAFTQAQPDPQLPMPKVVNPVDKPVQLEAPRSRLVSPLRLPAADVIVEVVATLPVRAQLTNVTRALERRHAESLGKNDYLPVIAELIMVVEPNPAKPRGRPWKAVTALTIGFDDKLKEVRIEYCVDNCRIDKRTRTPHPKRKMITYSAPEDEVLARLSKRLDELQPYRDPRL